MPVITDQKSFDEIHSKLLKRGDFSIVVIGCEDGARGCHTGGIKAVKELGDRIRDSSLMFIKPEGIPETMKEGLCDQNSIGSQLSILSKNAKEWQILLLCCGAGLKNFQDHFPEIRIVPGLNTMGVGYSDQLSCLCCGDCRYDETGCQVRQPKASQMKMLKDCYEKKNRTGRNG